MTERSSGRRRLLLPALGLAATGLAASGLAIRHLRETSQRPGSAYVAGGPLLIAHRGGAKLAPENTLVAFQRAVDWWRSDVLELDVQPTRDGEAVVLHDATLERTTDGRGPVAEQSLAQIRALDAGYNFTPDAGASFPFRDRGLRVPTLAEVLDTFRGLRVNIEIKDGRVQARVWESVRDADALDRVLIAAGHTRDRGRLKEYPVAVSASEEELRPFITQLWTGVVLYVPPVDAFQIPDRWGNRKIATPRFIAAAHRHNVAVHVWTVDEIDAMRRLLDWGADGIVTDRPDRLARLLHERVGRPLPPGPPDPRPEPFLELLLGS